MFRFLGNRLAPAAMTKFTRSVSPPVRTHSGTVYPVYPYNHENDKINEKKHELASLTAICHLKIGLFKAISPPGVVHDEEFIQQHYHDCKKSLKKVEELHKNLFP